MKIQLTIDQPQLDGYFWACPKNEKLDPNRKFYNCWEYCMEAQCTELYGPSILEIFTTSEIEEILPKWSRLICPNGKIVLGGTDLYILSKESLRRAKDLGSINDILFNKPYAIMSITSVESTRKFLESLNFKINNINIDYSNFCYTVEAIKNG